MKKTKTAIATMATLASCKDSYHMVPAHEDHGVVPDWTWAGVGMFLLWLAGTAVVVLGFFWALRKIES